MAFGDLLKSQTKSNQSETYKTLAYFFVHECGWSQQDFDEADVEFMIDIVEEHKKQNKKNGKKR